MKHSHQKSSLQSRYSLNAPEINYYKNLSFQKREGQIRLVNQIGNYHPQSRDHNISEGKYLRKKFGSVNTSIDVKDKLNKTSIDTYNRSSIEVIDRENNKSSIVIRDLPPTIRYLTKNAFGQGGNYSPKEKAKDVVNNIRSIFYSQMAIDAKQEETQKLKEYILMEIEKLEEARKTFEEDQEKFHRYLNDMESQADKAREQAESATKQRFELQDNCEKLQHQIQKYERDVIQIDDDLKQSLVYKEFIDMVRAQRRYKQKKQKGKGSKKDQQQNQDLSANFFITEEKERNQILQETSTNFNNDNNEIEVDLSKNEFLDIIQSLEDANLFLMDNIQTEEQELEAFQKEANNKYAQVQKFIDDIQVNTTMYQNKIDDNRKKKSSLKGYLRNFDEKAQRSISQDHKQSLKKLDTSGIYDSQIKTLKGLINKLYHRVKQSVNFQEDEMDNDAVHQLGEIERKLEYYLETIEYVKKHSDLNPESMKQLIEAEKNVDKERKLIRYEKKRKADQEMMKQKQLKVERRMERMNQVQNTVKSKIQMVRSNKPEIKQEDDGDKKILTLEEIEYLKYVEGQNVKV